MIISLIAAIDQTGLLGDDAGMPWHLPHDLKRFKSLTMGKPLVMGRKTHQLIGRPLPGRLNIVVTRDRSFSSPGCRVAHSLAEALDMARETDAPEVMIIGGGAIYREAIGLWNRLYLTVVEGSFTGTVTFPIDALDQQTGRIVHQESCPADDKNAHDHQFFIIDRDRTAGDPVASLVKLPARRDNTNTREPP